MTAEARFVVVGALLGLVIGVLLNALLGTTVFV